MVTSCKRLVMKILIQRDRERGRKRERVIFFLELTIEGYIGK